MNRSRRYCSLIFFLSLFSLPAVVAGDRPRTSSDFVVTHWDMDKGLPQSSVNDILQSKDGYLWLATFGGLVRFDGVNFTTFNRSNTPGMRSDRVLHVYEVSSGSLWIATEDGFLEFRNGVCTPHVLTVHGQIFSPLQVVEDARGVIWLSLDGKPFRHDGDAFVQAVEVNDPVSILRAERSSAGTVMAHEREIIRTLGDTAVQIADLSSRLRNNIQDIAEYPAGSGIYFLATSGEGVVRYDHGELTFFSEAQGLTSRYTRRLYVDKQNTLWVNCYNGLDTWNGHGFDHFTALPTSKEYEYTSVFEDNEGDHWIGTPSQGFYRVRGAIVTAIDASDGLWNEKMLSLTRLRSGRYLFATNCGGIFEWDGKRAAPSTVNSHLPNQCVWSILEDSKGNVWFGSRGLYRTSALDRRGTAFDTSNGFAGTDVFAMMEDRRGDLWVGCINGLFRYDGRSFRRYGLEDGLSYLDVRTLREDRRGRLWIGTSAGVNVMDNGVITTFDLSPVHKEGKDQRQPYVRAIHEDAEGTFWFGTYGDGLIRYKNGTLSVVTMKHGLFDNIVSHIVEDANGNFWMGCNRGIFRVRRTDLNELCGGKRTEVHSISYGTADGMPSSETNGGFQPNTVVDTNGTILFPTVAGVAVVNTRNVRFNAVAPPVHIERTITGSVERSGPDTLTMPYDSAFLEIRYTALSYPQPDKNQFRYKMEGLTEDWFNAGVRRSAVFSKIPPGEYVFRVIASNNDGVWNTAGDSLHIIVTPPFWMTWWFRAILGLLFLAVGPLVFYLRVTQLKKEKENQERFSRQLIESQEKERARIAAELHDGIGQQILVIKNRAEMALGSVNETARTEEQLREIMQSAVSSISDIRSIVHDLRPVHLEQFGLTETLTEMAEQLRESSPIEWSFHFDPLDGLIPSAVEIAFFRVIQESVNNILKHSAAREASVMVRHVEGRITATIWDDGKGFIVEEGKRKGGLGLSGMEERVKVLGGTLEIQSKETIGTTIRIHVPVQLKGKTV